MFVTQQSLTIAAITGTEAMTIIYKVPLLSSIWIKLNPALILAYGESTPGEWFCRYDIQLESITTKMQDISLPVLIGNKNRLRKSKPWTCYSMSCNEAKKSRQEPGFGPRDIRQHW